MDESNEEADRGSGRERYSPRPPKRRPLQYDEHGHAIPPTKEEQEETKKAMLAALEAMAAIPDDPPGSDEAFWRAIDAERPHRPLFREYYDKDWKPEGEPTMLDTTEEPRVKPLQMQDFPPPPTMRPLQLDEHGHAIPPTKEEEEEDTRAFLAALEEIAAIPDDPNEPDEVFWRAMDESRPHRPLFKDLYQS